MRLLKNTAVCVLGMILLIAVPFLFTDGFRRLTGGTDAVSGASVTVDAPSGNYIVLINRGMHSNASDLEAWNTFFAGGDLGIIFDDINCVTLAGDESALTLAQSFMSRLPENQMKVTVSDAVLALSKADNGRFDTMILSDEAAGRYGLESVYDGKDVDVIRVSGGADS